MRVLGERKGSGTARGGSRSQVPAAEMLRVALQESEGQQLIMGEQPWPWLAHHQGRKVTIKCASVPPLPRTASHPDWTVPILDLWWTWLHQVGNSRNVCDTTPHGEVQGTTFSSWVYRRV